ncbi:MAG: RND family transporter [Methanosarcinales archaeon]|jgi:hydrophobe/amphiphile efflux-3 (HAE3) family protein|nr:RND family transporter [Methanosarcinales archaeon]
MSLSLSGLFEKTGRFADSNRWLVFIGFIVLILVAFYGASSIVMYSGMDTYIAKESKMYQDLDKYNSMFSSENVVIMVEGANVYDPAVLKAADRFEAMMAGVAGVREVVSPAAVIKATNAQITGRSEIPASIEEVQTLIALNPAVYEGLIYDNTHSLILVSYSANMSEEQKNEILNSAKDAVNFSVFPPGCTMIVTGNAALNADMNTEMSGSMGILLLLALLLMVVALGLVFKGVRWRLYPLAIVIFGLIYTFGAMGFSKINMTMVSIAAFPILIGLGIDYAIQFHNRMEEELRRCSVRREAVISTFKYTGPAVLTALFVTCVSFVSLLTSSVPMIQDFGKLLVIGCIACYTAALFFGVISLYFLDKWAERVHLKEERTGRKSILSRLLPALERYKARETGSDLRGSENGPETDAGGNIITNTLNKVIDFTLRHKKTIFMVAVVTGILGIYADSTIPAETDFKTYIPQDMPALVDFYHMGSVMGGDESINIMIETSDISSPLVLKWMDEFGTYQTVNQDYVYGAVSLASVVKEENGGIIPDTEEEIRAIYGRLPASVMEQYSYGNSMLLLNLDIGSATSDLPMDGVKTLVEIVEEDLNWYRMPPGTTATLTGATVPYTELLDSLLSGRVQQTVLGVFLVFAALLLIYRDFYKSIGPVLTIGLVIGWSGLVMYAFHIVYTPMTAVMGCMILGAGSEYSILLMERYYEEKSRGLNSTEAMRTAVTNTGIALVVSGTTTIFGFLALTASSFGMLSSFGLVTVINMLMTLLASFVVFPPLMLTFDNFRDKGLRRTAEDVKDAFFAMIKTNKKTEMIE